MARGWESKSVEQQIEDRQNFAAPISNNTHENSVNERELEVLFLSKKRLEHEIAFASTRGFRAIKQRALAHIEARIVLMANKT